MDHLARVVIAVVLLDPAFILTQKLQDLPTSEPIPSMNMKFDSGRMNLTWDCGENITAVECEMVTNGHGEYLQRLKKKECHCTFHEAVLHDGATFTVTANVSQRQVTEKLIYTNPGKEGTAARNFSCVVYNADFMNCSWTKGQEAPEDVQYFLYIRDPVTFSERECPHYDQDGGTHVGCHLQDASELRVKPYFLINGTSQNTGVQFFDTMLLLKIIEIFNPPYNVSVSCNSSHCLIQWAKPRNRQNSSNLQYQYQVNIRRKDSIPDSDNQVVQLYGRAGNKYNFPSPEPRPKHIVKIRTSDFRLHHWSAWSQPVEFGSEEQEASLVPLYVLVVLSTLFSVLLLSWLCKRFLGMPIPQIKDQLNRNFANDNEKIAPASVKGENEEVLIVEEVGDSVASK